MSNNLSKRGETVMGVKDTVRLKDNFRKRAEIGADIDYFTDPEIEKIKKRLTQIEDKLDKIIERKTK